MTAVISAVVLAMVVMTGGGVVYASDDAVPGDALYGIDRAVEQVRLRLTTDSDQTAALGLELAEERLREAEELAEEGDDALLQEALSNYGAAISSAARMVETTGESGEEDLVHALAAHGRQLGRIFGSASENEDGGEDENGDEDVDPGSCTGTESHPVAEGLAELYDASYEDIMTWFCDGYGFGEIMLALETSQDTEMSAEELLALKTELGGWGLVWQELDLIGKPEDVPGGPPEDVPGGPPEDAPGGPPEDTPGGPPEDVPEGPPEDVPDSSPEDVPEDPPEDVPPTEAPPTEVPPTEAPPTEVPPPETPPTEDAPPTEPPVGGPPNG